MPVRLGGDDLFPWLIPYIFLLSLEVVRFFLLNACLEGLIAQEDLPRHPLYRFRALNIKWYKWLLYSLKDWLVLGALGVIAAWEMLGHVPLLLPMGMGFLALLILVRTLVLGILWLYVMGTKVPRILLKLALGLVLPSTEPSGGKRVLLWGGAFILTGGACLWSWVISGKPIYLLWGLVTLILGFISLLRTIDNSQELGGKGNAEKAG